MFRTPSLSGLVLSGLALLAPLAPDACAQTAYYDALRAEFAATHGLTGGTFAVGGDEATLWSAATIYGAASAESASAGTPFARALRLTRTGPDDEPYAAAAVLRTAAPVAAGDALVVVCWLRRVSAPQGGFVRLPFERAGEPFDKIALTDALPQDGWQRAVVSVVAAQGYAAGAAQWSVQVGAEAQTVEVAGVAVLNYGPGRALATLPQQNPALAYDGREAGAAWRTAAQARIDALRRSDVTVRVLRADGTPAAGADVRVRMLRHAFGFGSAVQGERLVGPVAGNAAYRARVADLDGAGHAFSMVTFENNLKWPSWETPWWPGGQAAIVAETARFRAAGVRVRGHSLVWPDWQYLPDDLRPAAADGPYLRDRTLAHIADVAGRPGLAGAIDAWDVLNEPTHTGEMTAALVAAGVYPDAAAAYRAWFAAARAADPAARLVVNEFDVFERGGADRRTQNELFAIAADLRAAGLLDGVGFQAHLGSLPTPPARVLAILDRFAALGVGVAVTEYDTAYGDEPTEGDYMRDLLTAVYSHPQATEFVMWGFWDGAHYTGNAPLFRQDWSLKPAGQAFLDLVFGAWWTDADRAADAAGEAAVAGAFHGTYRVEAALGDAVAVDTLDVLADGTITLRLSGTAAGEAGAPRPTRLAAVSPNPAATRVAVRVDVGQAGPVRVTVVDALGRTVAVLADGERPAGPFEAVWDARAAARGVYTVRLDAGTVRAAQRVTLGR